MSDANDDRGKSLRLSGTARPSTQVMTPFQNRSPANQTEDGETRNLQPMSASSTSLVKQGLSKVGSKIDALQMSMS